MSEKASEAGVVIKKTEDVCRDFLRNVCSRGDRCKFSHPSERADAGREVNDKLMR